MYRQQNNDPRQIIARFNSKCKETGQPIKKGESIIYYPSSKAVFKLDTRQAQEYREYLQDLQNGYNY